MSDSSLQKTNSVYRNARLEPADTPATACATQGRVRPDLVKIGFMGSMYAGVLVALSQYISTEHLDAILVFFASSGLTLLGGHSLGMHRLFIHRAWRAPRWLANTLLYLGTLVGLGGPTTLLTAHDLRDWAQRQASCHDYFAHRRPLLVDFYWQIFCTLELRQPPTLVLENDYKDWHFATWLDRTAFAQHALVGLILFLCGGLPWLVWGLCTRVAVGVTGHWLIGYFAHTPPGHGRKQSGADRLHVKGACTQGYNVPLVSLLCFGENWHNNHHAWPGSAKLGVHKGEWDPGWWVLLGLARLGLATHLVTPEQIPHRPELQDSGDHRTLKAPQTRFETVKV